MNETCDRSAGICAEVKKTAGTNKLAQNVFERMKNISFTGKKTSF